MELEPDSNATSGRPRYFTNLLRGLTILYGMPALALALNQVLPIGITMSVLLIVCLPSGMLMRNHAGIGVILAFFGLSLSAFYCFSLEEARELTDGGRVRDVTVHEASLNSEVKSFYFREAVIQRDLMTELRYRTGGKNKSISYYYVAPLTDPGWIATDPVRAWVVAGSLKSTDKWKSNILAGIRISEDQSAKGSALNSALRKAERLQSVVSVPHPLLIEWGDPDLEYQAYFTRLKTAAKWPLYLWFFGWTLYWIIKRLREPKD